MILLEQSPGWRTWTCWGAPPSSGDSVGGIARRAPGPGGEVLVQRVGGVGLADASDAGASAVADGVKAVIKGVRCDWPASVRCDWPTDVRSNRTAGVLQIPPAVAVGIDDAALAEHARHKPCIH